MTTTKGDTVRMTNYVNGFVYNNRTLNFYSSPEGRVKPAAAKPDNVKITKDDIKK
jgi:hypothetical protein